MVGARARVFRARGAPAAGGRLPERVTAMVTARSLDGKKLVGEFLNAPRRAHALDSPAHRVRVHRTPYHTHLSRVTSHLVPNSRLTSAPWLAPPDRTSRATSPAIRPAPLLTLLVPVSHTQTHHSTARVHRRSMPPSRTQHTDHARASQPFGRCNACPSAAASTVAGLPAAAPSAASSAAGARERVGKPSSSFARRAGDLRARTPLYLSKVFISLMA